MWEKSVEELLRYWFKSEHKVDENIIEAIKKLRQRGIKCYLATNQEKYRTEYFIHQMGLGRVFDGIFSSASIGAKKPEPAFFSHIKKSLAAVQGSEILYWDDAEENVKAAREFGFKAEVYTTFDQFKRKMTEYKLL